MEKGINDPYKWWQRMLLKNKPAVILKKLEDFIQLDGGLYRDSMKFKEFRMLALQFRIQLLMEWNRYAEALAWLCLETELNPTNVDALALKEQLKKKLYFTREEDLISIKNAKQEPIFNWGKVAGMRRVKAIIERDVLLPLKEREIYRNFNVSIPKGLLLYGPPGCGKTFIVKQIAKLLNFKLHEISPSSVASTYVHGTQEKIRETFDNAAKNKPVLLFIDELEAFVPNRTRTDVSYHYQAEVNEFLIQLNNAHQNGVFVVGATNHLNMIDEAVKRPGRFDKKLFVGPPDMEARIDAFKTHLQNKPNNITKWLYVGEETENYTFAEIQYVVDETARLVAASKKQVIDLNDLMKVIMQNPPEFDDSKLQKYY